MTAAAHVAAVELPEVVTELVLHALADGTPASTIALWWRDQGAVVLNRGELAAKLRRARKHGLSMCVLRADIPEQRLLVCVDTARGARVALVSLPSRPAPAGVDAPAPLRPTLDSPPSPHLGRSPDRGGSPDSAGFLRDPADHPIATDHLEADAPAGASSETLEARSVPAEPSPPAPRPRPRPSRSQPAEPGADDLVLVAPRTRVRVERPRYCARPHPKYQDDLAVYRPGVPRGGRVSPS